MTIEQKTILVTGANRGIGKALVEEALRRGANRVYAGTRQPLIHPDQRVTPLTLDVTNATRRGVSVQVALPGPVDTDMIRDFDPILEPQPAAA